MKNKGTQFLETNRLILRKFCYDDIKSMLKNWIYDKKRQALYCEEAYQTEEEVKKLIEKYINGYKYENYYRWAVILKENKECIGQIDYFSTNEKNNSGEIEYCIGEKYQNKGFATEATEKIISFGFESIGFHQILISHKGGNTASKRVIEKCGFTYDGTFRDYFFENGIYIDRVYYSIKENEFKGIKENEV